jgi:hypothetical protein
VQFVKHFSLMTMTAALVGCAGIDLRQMMGQAPNVPAPAAPVVVAPPAQPAPPAPVVVAPPVVNTTPLARDMQSYRALVGQKIVQSNSGTTFSGKLPDPLAAIPVIEITLNADGSIRGLDVRRAPRFYPETSQTAMDAIRRAAPFGSVAHLPQPWVFNETFLFNDSLKFQVLSLQP